MNVRKTETVAGLAAVGMLIATLPLAAAAQPTPVGTEFLVNTYTTGPQRFPDVCTLGEGDFVVAWEDGRANYFGVNHGVDGSETTTVARKLGGEPPEGDPDFQVNTYTTGRQGQPSVACLDDGGFVVVWSEAETYFPPMGEGRFGIIGRRYDDAGNPGAAFDIDAEPVQGGDPPDEGSVCRGPDGGFVVVWNKLEETSVRRYDAQGEAQGTDVHLGQVNNPKCCGSTDGFVVVGWQGSFVTNSPDVFGQRFSDAGALAGTQFTVNTFTTGRQSVPAVACNDAGRFVVVWESAAVGFGGGYPQDGDGYGVFGQLFAANGDKLAEEFQVNVYTTQNQYESSVGMDRAGRFVVTWAHYYEGDFTNEEAIFARAFDASTNPVGTEFQVNTHTTGGGSEPAIAVDPTGEVVITWHARNDGDDDAVSGQRYSLGTLPTTTTTSTTATTVTTTTVTTTTSTLPSGGSCGDPVALHAARIGQAPPSKAVTASDALFALKTAVGAQTCEPCVCDVDHSGSVSATDALIILKFAVGQDVTIECDPC